MTLLARPTAQVLQAWQYRGSHSVMPAWVAAAVVVDGSQGLLIERQSGRQLVAAGEWLLKHPDHRDLQWCTDAEFRRDYELTGRANG